VSDEADYKKHQPWIHTQFGRFYFDEPEFKPEAIAWALSQQNRYNGHTSEPYSVAEHCLMVSGIMRYFQGFGDPFEGLMHDASEAYLRDIPAPWKQFLPDCVAVEKRLDKQIRTAFNLPAEKSKGCNEADKIALFIESWYLMPDQGEGFTDVLGVRSTALDLIHGRGPDGKKWKVMCMDWKLAKHMWMEAFKEYGPKIEVAAGDIEMQANRAEARNKAEGHALVIP
jgi:hypothetical protein